MAGLLILLLLDPSQHLVATGNIVGGTVKPNAPCDSHVYRKLKSGGLQ
jgi:hypothetical protein